MSAEYESLSTASSDNVFAPLRSRELFKPGAKLSDVIERGFVSERNAGRSPADSFSGEQSSPRSFLSVPPLPGLAFSLSRKADSAQGNREFQALHPVKGPEKGSADSSVIDLAYLPDPYRLRVYKETTSESQPVYKDRPSERPNLSDTRAKQPSGYDFAGRSADALLGSSYRYLNTSPWQKSAHADYVDKSLAGAASLSVILQEQGYDYARSGSTANLVKSLIVNGWQLAPASKAEPGDLIFGGKKGVNWREVRGASDIGMVGTAGNIFHNDSASGEWRLSKRSRVFPKGSFGDQVWVLKAPVSTVQTRTEAPSESKRFHMTIPGPDSGDGQESQGTRDGRRAYEEVKSREGREANARPEDSAAEKGSEYWSNYWKDYWRDYWRDYYNKRAEARDTPSSSTRAEAGTHGTSLFDRARSRLGDQVWQNSKWADVVDGGRLGSATSVAQILQSLGYDYANSPGVANLARQLLSAGWKPVSLKDLRPGDVLYGGKNADWQKGGGNAHMAIVGENGKILHNKSATGRFTEESIANVYDRATYGDRIWALRPPADGPRSRPPERTRSYEDSERRAYTPGDNSGRGAENVVNAAKTSVGKAMFRPMLPMSMGRLGCAASVSGVLKKAGYNYANSTLVYGLHKQLTNAGWQKLPLSEARPGDVIIGIRRSSWKSGGGGSHIGIVGEGNTSYHNSSARRQWIKDSLSRWNTSRYRLGVYVLRPPSR